ncbi:MAG: hypothetical protein RR404_02800 [Bacilli bacterium]
MKELNKNELLQVVGGINITASFLAAISRGINSILDLGRSFGTSIRRIAGNRMCNL